MVVMVSLDLWVSLICWPISAPTDVRVRLLVATDDHSVGPALLDGLEAFAASVERVEMTGGHWLPRSRPVEVAAAIRGFTAIDV